VARQSTGADDVAATKRSYQFVTWVSVLAWAAINAGVFAATHASTGHRSSLVVAAVSGLALLGGLRRRELSRLDPHQGVDRYDPRSR
jgi:hypothetical protein